MSPLVTNLKVMLLNAENLFLLSDQQLTQDHLELTESQWQRLSTSIYDNKSILKCRTLARIIESEKPDIVMLCEVGGLESLKNFNRLFLQEQYSPALTEGNSSRNIDIGFLIRKDIGFYFDLVSNRTRSLNFLYPHEAEALQAGLTQLAGKPIQSHRFSRDAIELHLFLQDREKPFLILMLAHLKSRLDPDGIDPNGFYRRQAELKSLIEIYQELETHHQGEVPICVAGDFNGNASRAQTDPEFTDLYQKTSLEDVCELSQLPVDQRATYYQVGRSRVEGRQIDFCFLSKKAAPHLDPNSVHVFRYLDPRGMPADPPTTLEAKSLLPSDHYPLVFSLTNLPLR